MLHIIHISSPPSISASPHEFTFHCLHLLRFTDLLDGLDSSGL
uniref:Uncharacterized protein n=1 Tax=Rhizophora mucronata TaxID=61149 RepID=A0A2P2LDE8_RHIMU